MYLGIDLGTSAIKLLLLDEQQNVVAQNTQRLTVSHPKPLWSEQDPNDWWQATLTGISSLKNEVPHAFLELKAIGLSGQQHGAVLLDEHHEVLRPAILWNDNRSYAECDELKNRVPDLTNIIGNRIMPGFTAPKILWVAHHEPDIYKKITKVLLPKDYLRYKITHEFATDRSDASGTAWLNIKERSWSEPMLKASHLNKSHMPSLFEGSEITGVVSKEIAADWGIPTSTVVVGGGGDNPAAAISMNVIAPQSAFLSLGTSGVFFVVTDHYQANPEEGLHSFCHCLPKLWHVMSVHLSAASCLSWFSHITNQDVSLLLKDAENHLKDPLTTIFLPYLSGERTPHIDPHAKGVFFGLTHATKRVDMTRAILEGVAFAFTDGQDTMMNAKIPIREISVVGGGSQSYFWGTILASALNKPLVYRKNREVGAALGAARLAWLGVNPCDPKTAFVEPPIEKVIQPDRELVEIYAEKRTVFKKLYQNIKNLWI